MYLYFECLYIFWTLSYTSWTSAGSTTRIPECEAGKFNFTPLGHSNLLITWESGKKDYNPYFFDFKLDGPDSWDRGFERFLFEDGWYKIVSPLKENSRYQIRVWTRLWDCLTAINTKPKTNSFPTKPDFKVSMMNELKNFMLGDYGYQPKVRVEWLPCGKKKFCTSDEIAGVDFSVNYKLVNSTQEWRTLEKFLPYKYIFGLLPGKEYEVVVSSIYEDRVTDSDPQVISIKSICSPVQSVKIMSLPDSSVFLSWKTPKSCQLEKGDWLGYTVFYHISDNSPFILLNYTVEEKPYGETFQSEFESPRGVKYGQTKISNLTLGTSYTFFILPRLQNNIFHGSEYQIDFTPQLYEANITLAKPDFDYKFISFGSTAQHCAVVILWLPCGQTYDCKNMKPGSHFIVKYREGNGEIQEVEEERYDRTGLHISLLRDKKYELWVESVYQSDRIRSESKSIYTSKCEVKN